LETAIRNALDRSDRGDAQTRARIYQSARHALDAGLRRQGVNDTLVIMQQQKRLEDKIVEIENEEVDRLAEQASEPVLAADAVSVGAVSREPSEPTSRGDAVLVEGARRETGPAVAPSFAPPVTATQSAAPPTAAPPVMTPKVASPARTLPGDRPANDPINDAGRTPALSVDEGLGARRPGQGSVQDRSSELGPVPGRAADPRFEAAPGLDTVQPDPDLSLADVRTVRDTKSLRSGKSSGSGKPSRARSGRGAKPRRRRSFLAGLLTWAISLAVVALACWWFYTSGMVQSVMQEAIQAADRAARGQAGAPFDPRGAFSDDWAMVFKPADAASLTVGGAAKAEAVTGSEGPAVRIVSAAPDETGDVVVDVPADLLRQMAAKTSTIAITVQSGANQAAQFSVRCDFGSLGDCSRHRFTATQEKLEALFSVSFDRTLAPTSSGRLILNAGLDGADKSILLYSVRILPGH
jgi:hypothetical protein